MTTAQLKLTGVIPVAFVSPMSSQAPSYPFHKPWDKGKACVFQGLGTESSEDWAPCVDPSSGSTDWILR